MASENSYAQLIDDYENGVQVIEGESFDEYQKRMGGIDYNAYGGLTGMGYKNGGGIGSMMKSKKVPQLVTPSKDGSRPGYRGPGSYQGGRNASDRATGGQGRAAAREEARSQSNANSDRVSGDQYRAARNDFQQTLAANNAARSDNNTNQTNLTKFGFKKPENKFKKFFTPNNLASSAIGLFNKPAGILASMFGKMKMNNPFAGRGFNPDGSKRTQQEYEDARTNRQYVKRLDKMYARKDAKKGDRLYGKNFSQKNIDMIEGLGYNRSGAPEGILASENLNGIVSNNTENLKPKATITGPQYNLDNFGTGIRPSGPGYGLSGFQQPSTITGGMAPNDYEIDGTVDGITNYGFDQEDGITNYNFDPEVLVNRQNEFATPETMNQNAMEQDAGMYSGLPNQKLTNDAAMSVMMEAYNNSLPPPDNYNTGTEFGLQPNEGFENPNALYDDDNSAVSYYPQGNKLISSNNELPANNQFAEITQTDIDKFKEPMTQMMDYDTYKSINTDSTVTPSEFLQLKAMV